MEKSPQTPRRSLAFGLDRIGLVAFRHPRLAAFGAVILAAITVYGYFNISIDRDIRDLFRSDSDVYQTYAETAEAFVDPENQILVVFQGAAIGTAENLERVRNLHLDLQILSDVGLVFSPFSLRTRPDDDGRTRPLISDLSDGLTTELLTAVRAHPILGESLLSANGATLLFVITHAEAKASIEQHTSLIADIEEALAGALSGSEIEASISGFAPMRTEIVRFLERDQIVLNGAGLLIGIILSLLLFRSWVAAALTAIPAAFAGLSLLGLSGALGIPVTVLSNVVPALVMVLGYADGMHLTSTWRRYREEGLSIIEAERRALVEVGPACMLTALTTAVAFLSMTLSDTSIVRDFGWLGTFGTVFGTAVVLVVHGISVRLFGRLWQPDGRRSANLFRRLAGPAAGLSKWVTGHAWTVSAVAVPLTVVLGAAFFAVPPEFSPSETLSRNHPMVAALEVIDDELGGAFPVQIVVPMDGLEADSTEGLARIRAVHEAVLDIGAGSVPLSLWSLADWGGVENSEGMLADLPEQTRRLFVGEPGALVTVNIAEMTTAEADELVRRIEDAASAAVPGSVATGGTVAGTREATRTINNLIGGLGLAIIAALVLVAVALRSLGAGLVAAIPNLLPIFAVSAILYVMGAGMQMTSVVSLTVAFGIAIDDTIHYLNVLFLTRGADMKERLIAASHRVGPVLIGTTFVLVGGLIVTQTSGLASIALYGMLAASSLVVALIADLFFLPALIAGPARRLFVTNGDTKATSVRSDLTE